jgi:UMF1 family MFS transporter
VQDGKRIGQRSRQTGAAIGRDLGERRAQNYGAAVTGWVLYDLAIRFSPWGSFRSIFRFGFVRRSGRESRFAVGHHFRNIDGADLLRLAVAGAMTDRARRRMPFLICSTMICVCFTALLARLEFYWTALFFVIANMAYQAGTQFYDAMLPEVSTEQNRGRIGGIGVGVGYLGSYIALGLGFG